MQQIITEDARLIMLKALSAQPDETLHSELLRVELASFGIKRDREWVHDEIAWLAEHGAVTASQVGTVQVARLTEKGARHLSREIAIAGIKRPAREE